MFLFFVDSVLGGHNASFVRTDLSNSRPEIDNLAGGAIGRSEMIKSISRLTEKSKKELH